MKICMVAWNLDIQKHAGVGRVGAELYNGLIKRGYQVEVMTLNNTNHMKYSKYIFWDIPRRLPKADIYIAQSPMETIWLPKDKTICITHDLIPLLHPKLAGANMNANPIKTFLGSRTYWFGAYQSTKCARIVCNSQQTKDELISTFKVNPDKVIKIDLGVRSDLDYQSKKDNIFRIGYIGQLDKRKRVNLLIEAFKQTDIDGELVIGGSGPDRVKLQELAGSDKRIKFLGFVPDSELCNFYNSLDLFCFPSAAEGWGIPITEAMACKKPVLVLQDAFIPKELARFSYSSLPNVFSKMLSNLYDSWDITGWQDSYAPDKVPTAYKFAHYFTWDKFVEKFETVIKEVANG
jgi:glycosyltransferase involved in cell wall biosynthesis